MQKQVIPVATGDVARSGKQRESDRGGKSETGPIRKQSSEERRNYMREYMRAYRLQHPGLSTPYVRKYRAGKRPEST